MKEVKQATKEITHEDDLLLREYISEMSKNSILPELNSKYEKISDLIKLRDNYNLNMQERKEIEGQIFKLRKEIAEDVYSKHESYSKDKSLQEALTEVADILLEQLNKTSDEKERKLLRARIILAKSLTSNWFK